VLHCETDPALAVARAEALEPTVILQDLVMPGIDGLTLLRTFREHPRTRQVPMIVLSSKEEPKTKAEAFALGASDYLVKLPDTVGVGAAPPPPPARLHRAAAAQRRVRSPAAQPASPRRRARRGGAVCALVAARAVRRTAAGDGLGVHQLDLPRRRRLRILR